MIVSVFLEDRWQTVNRHSSFWPLSIRDDVMVSPEELRIGLRNLAGGVVGASAVAGLFAALYESFALMPPGERRGAWASFIVAEGLRVEDLDSQPGDETVRGFACALACAGLSQRAVATVVSRSQKTVSRYLGAFGCPGPRKSGTSPSDFADSVLDGLMAWADTEPLVPKDALLQVAEHLEAVPRFVAECEAGLAQGAPVDRSFDRLLHGLHRELEKVTGSLQSLGQARGIRL